MLELERLIDAAGEGGVDCTAWNEEGLGLLLRVLVLLDLDLVLVAGAAALCRPEGGR